MTDKAFPPVPGPLLEALQRAFPDRIPDKPGVASQEVLIGNQQVIRFLRSQFEEQNETILEKN